MLCRCNQRGMMPFLGYTTTLSPLHVFVVRCMHVRAEVEWMSGPRSLALADGFFFSLCWIMSTIHLLFSGVNLTLPLFLLSLSSSLLSFLPITSRIRYSRWLPISSFLVTLLSCLQLLLLISSRHSSQRTECSNQTLQTCRYSHCVPCCLAALHRRWQTLPELLVAP